MPSTPPPIVAERLTAQGLADAPERDPVAVAERLLAVQAQDARGARLAVRARSAGLTAADVDRALTADRSLVVSWLNRGTLHLVRSADYPWLQLLTTPPLRTGNARRLAQEGVPPDAAARGAAAIERALATEGPLRRAELRERVAAAGVRTEGQALVHVLMRACLDGIAVRGPMVGGEQAYVRVRDWLGERPPVDRAAALGELARRYLVGHGPAGERDLAKWAGLPLRDVRSGLRRIAPRLRERHDGLLDLADRPAATGLPPPRLLGVFEPLLLGWTAREPLLGAHAAAVVVGGLFRPFALVRGRAAATWALRDGAVVLEPFAPLAGADADALAADAADVVRFLGLERRAAGR